MGNMFFVIIVFFITTVVIMMIVFFVLASKMSGQNMDRFRQTSQQIFSNIQNMQQKPKGQTEPKKCPYCGTMNDVGNLKCSGCDAPLG